MDSGFFLFWFGVSTFLALLGSLLHGSLNSLISICSIILAIPISYFLKFDVQARSDTATARASQNKSLKSKSSVKTLLYLILFGLTAQQCFGFLYQQGNAWLTLNACNFGDMPFHISLIRSFSAGAKFWPMNPVFWQASLRYPLGMDLFNAMFDSLGAPLTWNLCLTGLVLLVLSFRTLDLWGGVFVVLAFFCSGGVARFSDFYSPIDMIVTDSFPWKNLFLTVWVTQRGFQFALPAGVLVLVKVREWFESEHGVPLRQQLAVGWLAGSIALFSLHSFLILSLFLFGLAILKKKVLKLMPCMSVATVVGAVVVFFIFSQPDAPKDSLMSWHWNWTKPDSDSSLFFWLRNFGFFFVFATGFSIWKIWQKNWDWLWLAILAITMSALILAPWKWDQVKVILWIYIFVAGFLAAQFKGFSFWQKFWICFLCFTPGFAQLWFSSSYYRHALPIFYQNELSQVQKALEATPPDSRFFILPSHNHAVFYFGRLAVMGHPGHVWSHGYQYQETEQMIQDFMSGTQDWAAIAKKVQATHVYWGPAERARYGDSRKPWMDQAKMILDSPAVQIWQLPDL